MEIKYGLPTYLYDSKPEFDKEKEMWYFQCAYLDASAKPHVLPSYIYDNLPNVLVSFVVKQYNTKYFRKKLHAILALKLACIKHIYNELKNLK